MAYINLPNGLGKIHIPDKQAERKHNCKDCFFCQMCSDTRCQTCLKNKKNKKSNKQK